jgi:hypothetical protein
LNGRSHASLSETRRASHRSARALHVLRQFRLIYGSVRQQFRDIEATCKLSGSKLWMLQEINSAPGIGVTRLAQKLSIHQTAVGTRLRLFAGVLGNHASLPRSVRGRTESRTAYE